MSRSISRAIIDEMNAPNKEAARALPDNRGGETPKQLQNDRTVISSSIVPAGQAQLLFTSQNWVIVTVTLRSPTQAVIATNDAILPVSSFFGRPLIQDEPFKVTVPRATTIYVASEATSRFDLIVEPIPWFQQISAEIRAVTSAVIGAAASLREAIALAAQGRSISPPAPPSPPIKPRSTLAPLTPLAKRPKDRG